jgi:hypothetical protein
MPIKFELKEFKHKKKKSKKKNGYNLLLDNFDNQNDVDVNGDERNDNSDSDYDLNVETSLISKKRSTTSHHININEPNKMVC